MYIVQRFWRTTIFFSAFPLFLCEMKLYELWIRPFFHFSYRIHFISGKSWYWAFLSKILYHLILIMARSSNIELKDYISFLLFIKRTQSNGWENPNLFISQNGSLSTLVKQYTYIHTYISLRLNTHWTVDMSGIQLCFWEDLNFPMYVMVSRLKNVWNMYK